MTLENVIKILMPVLVTGGSVLLARIVKRLQNPTQFKVRQAVANGTADQIVRLAVSNKKLRTANTVLKIQKQSLLGTIDELCDQIRQYERLIEREGLALPEGKNEIEYDS
jgi:hypothetical protein